MATETEFESEIVVSKYCVILFPYLSLSLFHFQKEEVFLNLVLEYVPETVYRVARHYSKNKQTIPILYVKVSVKCKSTRI